MEGFVLKPLSKEQEDSGIEEQTEPVLDGYKEPESQ